MHSLHETNAEFRFNNYRYKEDGDIYCSGAMKYLTNLEKHVIVNLERFMIRCTSALYPSVSRKGIWAIINGITNGRQHEEEIKFVGKKILRRRRNEASVIRAAIQEHRAFLRLLNPADKISDM